MAILAVDEVMLREPRLLIPNEQPLGRVRIDWSHPLTRGLTSYVLAGVDIAKNIPENTSQIFRPRWFTWNQAAYDQKDDQPASGDTVIASVEIQSNPGWYGIGYNYYLDSSTNNQFSIGIRGDSGKLYGDVRYNSSLISDLTPTSVSFPFKATLALTAGAANGTAYWYRDGIYQAGFSQYNTRVANSNKRMTGFGGASTAGVNYIMHFARGMSDNDIMELYKNPYQFLIPA